MKGLSNEPCLYHNDGDSSVFQATKEACETQLRTLAAAGETSEKVEPLQRQAELLQGQIRSDLERREALRFEEASAKDLLRRLKSATEKVDDDKTER